MKNFSGKIAFIVGGASGAGLGQAKLFGGLGMKVSIADVRQSAIDTALAELKSLGIQAAGYQVDITDEKWYTAVADAAERQWGGPPHLVIHTAGVNSFGPAEASTFADYKWIVGVNLYGPINSCVIWVPRILKAYKDDIKAGKTEAALAFVSSMGAFDGYDTDAPYSVSKAGLNNLAYSYYKALKKYGIHVVVQCPANINSNIGEAIKTRPADLADSGYYTSEGTINMLKSIHATGIDPVKLAEYMKFALENEIPISLPFEGDDPAAMMRSSYDTQIKWASLKGMEEIKKAEEERAEMFRKMREEGGGPGGPGGPGGGRPGGPGPGGPGGGFGGPPQSDIPMETFGQAKPELDWVDEGSRKK
ncbi:MAG: SDR family NAD(P)-dependent oxidoreductase [Oscillospiraceae bacterium]|jgi:NAD(P)-dependent dehydrogenase (short-subunit alcohol dehydrogenase family)|nr:SDR family NAD(P)-dependent oxidoreductase [Oscillospiraceae bacterium]